MYSFQKKFNFKNADQSDQILEYTFTLHKLSYLSLALCFFILIFFL
jgi:hypothetical protein